jgi:glycosyltransferase involved in cell wall biosynthesis
MPKILSAADAIVASTFDYIENSEARQEYLDHTEKWVEIPFGVDSKRFFPQEKDFELFSRYELDSSAPTLLFVGGMDIPHEFKGVSILLAALVRVKTVIPNIQAVFVGDGELREKYEIMSQVMHLSKNVRFVGRVSNEELPAHYALGDLFILPSIHQAEAFGVVLLEAMSSGVPVIASDIPGVRSVASTAGFTFPVKDVDALATLIAGYFELPKEKQIEWKETARQTVLQKFSSEVVLDQLEALYIALFAKK